MKKTVLSLLTVLAVAGTSFAGHEVVRRDHKSTHSKGGPVPVPEQCFRDQELQIDVFAVHNSDTGSGDNAYESNAWGGGVGINYFFARYFGVGIDANWSSFASSDDGGGDSVLHQVASNFYLRYPLEFGGHFCIAPYVYAGGGGNVDGDRVGEGHAGAGLEWRVTQNWGIFSDGRYIWTGSGTENIVSLRAGVRFVF